MKLNKEEIQKLILGALLFVALVYGYFEMLLGPLQVKREAAKKSIEALVPEIDAARADMAKARRTEAAAPEARATVAQITAMIPEGSPVAWFPPRIADFFKNYGVERAATRMNNDFPEKELPGFRRLSWGIELPKVDFIAFATAIAELENQEPLLEITTLQLNSSRDEVDSQHALLTINNLVTQ